MTDVLSDLLQHSLRIVLCGTAAGTTSAAERAYYAHRQNKFWKILHETRLTPELLRPHQYRSLLQHGIGLTDLVKAGAGMDRATLPKLTAADRARLRKAIATFRPQFLAFTSKTAGQKFFDGKRDYGEQLELIGTRAPPCVQDSACEWCAPRLWPSSCDAVVQLIVLFSAE